MRVIETTRKQIDPYDYIKRAALPTDYKELIKEDIIIKENGRIVLVYIKANEISNEIVDVLKRIKYSRDYRTSGLWTNSRIFGYRPREQIRKDFCSSASLAVEQRTEHDILCNFGTTLAQYYQKYAPEIYEEHMNLTNKHILKEWTIEKSPFTSGIINKNNPLKYHYDNGNLDNVYSNMIAFKKNCTGGHLALPEFDIGLEIADKSILFFDGQDILHGVTPFTIKENGYRFTVVYYTLKLMWNCEPLSKELARIKKRKTERERQRFLRLTGQLKEDKAAQSITEKRRKI